MAPRVQPTAVAGSACEAQRMATPVVHTAFGQDSESGLRKQQAHRSGPTKATGLFRFELGAKVAVFDRRTSWVYRTCTCMGKFR